MRKVILDFNVTETREDVHAYLAMKLDLPDYYGGNLDALYDMLTSLGEDTCIGFFSGREAREISPYLKRVAHVMCDAEEENPHLAVIFGDLEENFRE
jgi:ribonuclease inhibitor